MLRSRPPYWNIARKDPFRLGHVCVRRPQQWGVIVTTVTTIKDRWLLVTMVTVVMVGAYCLHRRTHRYLPTIRPSHRVGLLHPRWDVPLAVQHAPDVDVIGALDVEHEVWVACQ